MVSDLVVSSTSGNAKHTQSVDRVGLGLLFNVDHYELLETAQIVGQSESHINFKNILVCYLLVFTLAGQAEQAEYGVSCKVCITW